MAEETAVPEGAAGRRRRLVVLLICSSSLFITYLDSTILNVALPTLERDLHASVAGLQWVTDAYLLAVSSLLLLTGSTADRLGRKRLFLAGLVVFTLGSLLCSLAPDTGWLVALRMLQGIGGSMLNPISLSIVRNTFHDPRERAQALGIWSGIFGVAAACGPVAGGLLVSTVGWRAIFFVNVPLGAAIIAAAVRYLPESRAPRPRRADLPGQLLMIAFLGALTYALIQAPESGWSAPLIVALFAAAAVSLAAFAVVERRRAEPLLELRFFRSRPFTGASVIAVLAFVVMGGFLFVITLYLQQARGFSPLRAGLALLPATAAIAVAAPVAGRLNGRHGPRIPLVASGLFLAAGLALLLPAGPGTPFALVAAAFAFIGVGLGLVNPPITNTGVSGMPPAQAGVAAAVISVTRQIGSVLGVAVMGDLVTTGVRGSAAQGRAHAAALSGAAHGAWAVALGCSLAIALVGYLSTTARAQATAAAVARASGAPAPVPAPAPAERG